jgi:signal transduction histidine kinase
VLGAFQIDPDGSVHTPLRPRDEALATRRGDWPPPPETLAAIERVTALAREAWAGEEAGRLSKRPAAEPSLADAKAQPAPALARQDPGTTRAVGGPWADKLEAAAKKDRLADGEAAEEEGVDVFSALQRLNTGAEQRKERRAKVEQVPQEEAYGFARSAAPPTTRESAEVLAERAAPDDRTAGTSAGARPTAPAPARGRRSDTGDETDAELVLERLRALGYSASGERPARDLDAAAPVRLALDPMVGRAAGDDVLLLHRTVLVGQQGYRQGLALDRSKLAAWLTARALGPSRLAGVATLRFDAAPLPATGDERYVFQHRFAEPFDAISARLALVALPGVGSPGAIYALVAVLALVGVAGLLAVYRMVSVTVDFAERRSSFVSAVTHELKTPLTAIRMYAEMLRDGLVPGEAKKEEYYGTITDESERLSRLIDNVLEFSRLERGTREMNVRAGPLEPVVREAVDKLRAHAAKQGFSLEVDVAPELPPVRYDRDALLQVLFNLVDNAMKYAGAAPERRVVIEARAEGGEIVLAVRDFGPGVSGGHLARIFEPFYRGEDEMTRSTKGTGIGLALVRDLSERMGAKVRGANAPGGGFRVSLAFEAAPSA